MIFYSALNSIYYISKDLNETYNIHQDTLDEMVTQIEEKYELKEDIKTEEFQVKKLRPIYKVSNVIYEMD